MYTYIFILSMFEFDGILLKPCLLFSRRRSVPGRRPASARARDNAIPIVVIIIIIISPIVSVIYSIIIIIIIIIGSSSSIIIAITPRGGDSKPARSS